MKSYMMLLKSILHAHLQQIANVFIPTLCYLLGVAYYYVGVVCLFIFYIIVTFTGTSRMRTFYYDLLSYFGFSSDEIDAYKAHHHMSHNILAHAKVNITLHYHWNDCESDVPKGNYMLCMFPLCVSLRIIFNSDSCILHRAVCT